MENAPAFFDWQLREGVVFCPEMGTNDLPGGVPTKPVTRRRITRKQASLLLGRKPDTVILYHGKQLHPEKDANGHWTYDREEVERLAVVLRSRKPTKRLLNKGDLASEVFQCFDLGIGFRDIVMRFRIDPDELRKLKAEYDADGAPRQLTPADRVQLEKKALELETERIRLSKMQMQESERLRRRSRDE